MLVRATYLPGCGILDHLEVGDVVVPVFGSSERLVLLKQIRGRQTTDDSAEWLVIERGTGRRTRRTLLGPDVRFIPRAERV